MTDLLSVHAAIAAVINELPAIGKDNKMQGGGPSYAYRGIEQIKEALKPLLGKHGVHYAPETIEQVSDGTEPVGNKQWQRVRLVVGYRIYGPDGSSIPAIARGEGFDNSDKANNKAMTMAEKQMLIQVFCVADGEPDPDHTRPERGEPAPVRPETAPIAGVKQAIVSAIGREEAQLFWAEFGPKDVEHIAVAVADRLVDDAKAWAHDTPEATS